MYAKIPGRESQKRRGREKEQLLVAWICRSRYDKATPLQRINARCSFGSNACSDRGRPRTSSLGGLVSVSCSYLVDPASSHMLVSKIKPCMSKYKHLYCETANGSLNQLSFI